MALTNSRINISLSKQQMLALSALAQEQGRSVAAVAREFIANMLEHEDDARFVAIAEARKNEQSFSQAEVEKMFGIEKK